MSIYDSPYSHLFTDEIFEKEEWAKYRFTDVLKVSSCGGKGSTEEGIQDASKFSPPGKENSYDSAPYSSNIGHMPLYTTPYRCGFR